MADIRICDAPVAPDWVRFNDSFGQRFLVTVDTEEEFDWSQPFDREAHTTATVPALRKFQQFCDGYGVVPAFLVDYPVAVASEVPEGLREAVAAGRAEIGMQLHPWVNPPFEEELNTRNSYAGNLPASLERAKFETLRAEVSRSFDVAPRIYRAGRYGTGPHTAAILRAGGIAIDTSVRARFDYSRNKGPDYSRHPVCPYWLDRPGGLLELPLTTVFDGRWRARGDAMFPVIQRIPRMRGLLARTGLLERISLTPEGISIDEAIRGIDHAIDDGLPVLVLSFHSPSLAPGNTPYVRTHADLDAFYDWWRQVFAHLASRGIRSTSVSDIMASVALA